MLELMARGRMRKDKGIEPYQRIFPITYAANARYTYGAGRGLVVSLQSFF
jgi:hypothetical protein